MIYDTRAERTAGPGHIPVKWGHETVPREFVAHADNNVTTKEQKDDKKTNEKSTFTKFTISMAFVYENPPAYSVGCVK